jgi:hypothetical protein
MDYEFFWRLILAGRKFVHCRELAGALRTHENAKGVALGAIAQAEGFQIYRWLLRQSAFSPVVREKLLRALYTECLNDFGHHRLATFRRHARELLEAGGWRTMNFAFLARWILSFLGERCTRVIANRQA